VTAAGATLTLARFSEAFLVLRAQDLGLALAWAPLVLVGMNAVFALVAWPAGRLADRLGPGGLLAAGTVALVAADLCLAFAGGLAALAAGVALWGLHMGLTQGLLAAMVAAARRPTGAAPRSGSSTWPAAPRSSWRACSPARCGTTRGRRRPSSRARRSRPPRSPSRASRSR